MPLACIEVGGSSVETLLLADDGTEHRRLDGAVVPDGHRVLVAVPGIVEGNRVLAASNLGWFDIDPLRALGLDRSADLVLNDAEAAALGEVALRHDQQVRDAVYVGLGTGVGGAVVIGDRIVAGNLFGHQPGFSDLTCPCGAVGCLETVAAGWALPTPLRPGDRDAIAAAVARAIDSEPLATPSLVVIAGGLARRYPDLVPAIGARLPDRSVAPSAAPNGAKSAAAWGLRLADELGRSVPDLVR
ncbi:MAG TPA: ROK family protein [Nitriliruptorales bacterium]